MRSILAFVVLLATSAGCDRVSEKSEGAAPDSVTKSAASELPSAPQIQSHFGAALDAEQAQKDARISELESGYRTVAGKLDDALTKNAAANSQLQLLQNHLAALENNLAAIRGALDERDLLIHRITTERDEALADSSQAKVERDYYKTQYEQAKPNPAPVAASRGDRDTFGATPVPARPSDLQARTSATGVGLPPDSATDRTSIAWATSWNYEQSAAGPYYSAQRSAPPPASPAPPMNAPAHWQITFCQQPRVFIVAPTPMVPMWRHGVRR